MPYVPHTSRDEQRMLETIGAKAIEDLFDEIPPELRAGKLQHTPPAITEMALMRLMSERAAQDAVTASYLGAGAYEHHIPAAVWDLVSRGEFMTAYTPYQAEASQGTLQLIYEFQTMITRLTAMDAANASVYDGASALAEAILMSVRANRGSRSKRVLVPETLNPRYFRACEAIVSNQGIELVRIPFDQATGLVQSAALAEFAEEDFAALVIPYPNFFGGLDAVDLLTDWAHQYNQLVIAVVNPMALGLLTPPGRWGETGADIVVGEAQPFGIPVASGGPYCGFMCCRQSIVRQMPGRIIGKTVDTDGKVGFALTLQAREQHIRRGKATSNICTNQGLLVTAATIYLSLMGDAGLQAVASRCHQNTLALVKKVSALSTDVKRRFTAPVFHEVVLEMPRPAREILALMAEDGLLAGYDLGLEHPDLDHCILVAVTETKTEEDLEVFASSLTRALEAK